MPQLDQATFISQLITILVALCFLFIVINAVILPKIYQSLRLRELAIDEATFQVENICTLYGLTSFNYKNSLDISVQQLENLFDELNGLVTNSEFICHFEKLVYVFDNGSFLSQKLVADNDDINDTIMMENLFSLYLNFYFMYVCNILCLYMIDAKNDDFSYTVENKSKKVIYISHG